MSIVAKVRLSGRGASQFSNLSLCPLHVMSAQVGLSVYTYPLRGTEEELIRKTHPGVFHEYLVPCPISYPASTILGGNVLALDWLRSPASASNLSNTSLLI